MNNKKYIFFDVDGTLVRLDGLFPESTKKALEQVQKNGHKIFVCTGRAKAKVHDCLLKFGFDGFVAATGAYIEYKNNVIFNKYMSKKAYKNIMEIFQTTKTPFMIETSTDAVFSEYSLRKFIGMYLGDKPVDLQIEELLKLDVPFLPSLLPIVLDDDTENYPNVYIDTYNINYVDCAVDVDTISKILGSDAQVDKASFSKLGTSAGEITVAGCSKAKAIQKFIKHEKISKDDIIVVGDGPNDIDMMKFATTSIAMGNAIDEIKDIATYVTTNIEDDGIANGLKHYNLI